MTGDGFMYERITEDGELLVLVEMMFNVRLCVGDPDNRREYERGWCYQKVHQADALHDAKTWDGRGQPPGRWFKDLQTQEYKG